MPKQPQTNFHDQGVAFRATGKGLINKLPNVVASEKNANAVLVNTATGRKLYLFCTGVSTGWKVNGSFGQGAGFRTFYPRAFSQDDVQIKCVVANQHQYDLMIEFVQRHHRHALSQIPSGKLEHASGMPVDFKLFEYRVPKGRDRAGQIAYRTIHDAMHYGGFITIAAAGHDHVTNAPAFILNLKVSHDFLNQNIVQTGLINIELMKKYLGGFGQRFVPELPKDLQNPVKNLIEDVDDFLDNARDTVSDIGNDINNFFDGLFP